MLDKDYFNKLSEYVGTSIVWTSDNDSVVIKCDVELKFIITHNNNFNYCLYSQYRNNKELIARYSCERELKRKLALRIKNVIGNGIDYRHSSQFRKTTNINDLNNLISLYCDSSFYSINLPEKGKINLESVSNDEYSIYYIDLNGNRHYIEKNKPIPFAFTRFYNEVTYLEQTIEQINQYSKIFNDDITDKETLHKLIYGF